jgi:cytoskeletal protein CcmA (bactofilin family)
MNVNKFFVYFFVVILLSGLVLAEKDSFVLSEEYGKNLYLTNNMVITDANLYGDLFAVSEKIDVNELVQDDINAVAGKFTLTGTVGSDLRLVASSTVIDGTVFGETMILGNDVEITEKAALGGPVRINAKTVIIDGNLKNNLNVNADKVVINGVIEGNAVIQSSVLEMGPDARILGDFSSTRSIDGMSSKVDGVITKMANRDNPDNFTSVTFRKIGMFLTLFLIGAVLIVTSRKFTERTEKRMKQKFFLSLGLGILALVVAPFVAILLLFTVVGIPIALLIGLVYCVAMILAFGLSAIFAGKICIKLFTRKSNALWTELLMGALILALISIISVVVWLSVVFGILMAILVFVAIGAGIQAAFGKDKKK